MTCINYNGKEYILPKRTMKVVEAEDMMRTPSNTLKEAYAKQFDYLKKVFDEKDLSSMLGSLDINEVDLAEVTLICNMVDSAYIERINKQQLDKANQLLNNKAFNKTIQFAESADKLSKVNRNRR